jgi:hypothetical protein
MVEERRNVEFPLWRKKVDGSLFEHAVTIIPNWVAGNLFDIRNLFTESSKDQSSSDVAIDFVDGRKTSTHEGSVVIVNYGKKWERKSPTMRLFFDNALKKKLRQKFRMSHMRDLERRMRKERTGKCTPAEIESEIPFYEFLDIEWDVENRKFIFRPHYIQAPIYDELFTHLQSKHVLDRIENELAGGSKIKISKGDWKERSEIQKEIQTENVIYTLIDVNNSEIYVGEANNLANRFKQNRHEIPEWTHYRVDQLPDYFDEKMRVTLERMMIRYLASLLENSADVESMKISDVVLKNKRIDK